MLSIETGWGELPVSDAHIHFFSHKFLSLLVSSQRPQSPISVEAASESLGWTAPPEDPRALAAAWVEELDRSHVTRAALIASLPQDADSVVQAVGAFPSRFAGYFLFNPLAPHANAAAAFEQGLRCACLFPALHHYDLHDSRVASVYAEAARHPSTAIFIHCGTLSIGIRKKLGLPTVYAPRFANPLDVMEVAQSHPGVPFIIPHFGAGMLREALLTASQCPNVFLDTSSSNSWMAAEELDLRTVFRRALSVVGPDRLLFGTDSSFFPRGWNKAVFDAQAKALYELGIDAEAAAKVFSGNFNRLFPAQQG